MKYIVLGAGLSGLSCASALREAGNDVVVLEKEREVGGLARCLRANGFTFDYGPHFLFGDSVLPLLKEIAPSLQLKPVERNMERIFLRGKFFNFPFDPKNLLLNMEGRYVPGTLFDLFWKKMRSSNGQGGKGGDLESWVIDSVGRRVYEYICLGEYVRKLYGLDPKCVSQEWGLQKLKFMSRWRNASFGQLATKALGEGERLRRIAVSYPSVGIDAIAKSLAERFTQMGGSVLLDAEAVAISFPRRRVMVACREQGKEHGIEGDFLISTIPVVNLVQLINPPANGKVQEVMKALRYRTLLLLFLYLDREQSLDFLSLYFTGPSYVSRRITNFKRLSSCMAPARKSSLCVEMTCFERDAMDLQEGEEILHTVVHQLNKGGFVNPDSIEGYRFLKVPYAYPVYEVGYENSLKRIFDELVRWPNILSMGRQGLFFYNTMSNSIMKGYHLGTELSRSSGSARADILKNHYSERLQLYAG